MESHDYAEWLDSRHPQAIEKNIYRHLKRDMGDKLLKAAENAKALGLTLALRSGIQTGRNYVWGENGQQRIEFYVAVDAEVTE